jgi:isopentenyl-diphosphate delta-isomerase
MTEYNIEVDENNIQIGLRPREDFKNGRYMHRSVHLILFNSKNEILLQRRSSAKTYPFLFTYSVNGTVADETYEECIKREMEIGISVGTKRLFTYPFLDKVDKSWHCVFVGKSDEMITPNEREIDKIEWIDADKLKDDIIINSKRYTPPFIEGMKIYFEEFYRR